MYSGIMAFVLHRKLFSCIVLRLIACFFAFFCCGRLGHCHWLGGYVFKVCPIQVR